MSDYQGRLGDYVLGKKLGAGQFSKVRIGEKEGKKYAVKYMIKDHNLFKNKTCLDLVFNEAKVMMQLDHPNIVKLHDFSDAGVIKKPGGKEIPVLYLIFELITGGEIFDYIAIGGRLSDHQARFYFKQLLSSLEYLYSKGYAHRDIKAENVLLDADSNLKLADFGFATLMQGKDGTGKLHSMKGTMGYMAPEMNVGHSYSGEKVDLFAVGVLLFIMVAQHPPFRKATVQDVFYKMFCQQNELFWTKMSANKPPGVFTENFKNLVNALMNYDPTVRPSIALIKAHPWFNEYTPTLAEIQADFAVRKTKIEQEWRLKAQEALMKKKIKREQEAKKKAALGGYAPHLATKGGMPEEKTVKAAVKRILPEHKVFVQKKWLGCCL